MKTHGGGNDGGVAGAVVEFRTSRPEIFDFLLQEGFQVSFVDRCTIREFLCCQLALCGDYTEKNIQTIFLNSRPVDDVDAAVLRGDDRLALSAAMPGLVGATMRKRGFFAKMRHSISHDSAGGDDRAAGRGKRCLIQVKLFNLLARDLARDFLARGIFFPVERLCTLLGRRPVRFFADLNAVSVNGEPLDSPKEMEDRLRPLSGCVQLRLLGD
ncbi:hypothetical protein GKC30_09560 [Pseudodesulfovibrio sp. F-1]|uniref:Uncharacterized protein n=1 Tax=Pseudodesulfovibrio alkaliphilus TaxID=2661613 RepID=A0A7K1KPH2_9BACT|nr:hypothetical protein [Pseudodesulfovibrio alkaliphilus]MUM77880.1 hypothetical protein [Pseudodesulfovibrio alkaliphilus]